MCSITRKNLKPDKLIFQKYSFHNIIYIIYVIIIYVYIHIDIYDKFPLESVFYFK